MLERATACLDSGARLSVRCARRASRSSRSLGPTFWNHGAGDSDLLPWTQTHSHASQEPLEMHHSGQKSQSTPNMKCDKATDTAPSEGPFLDFLYPPQALALLHRNGSQNIERWERRNERRLPKGFVHPRRRYVTKATLRQTAAQKVAAELDEDGGQVPEDRTLEESSDIQPEHDAEAVQEPHDESANMAWHDAFSGPSSLKELQSLMSDSRFDEALRQSDKSLEYTEKAWALYEELEERDREDVIFKKKLLEWLAKNRNEIAETRCLELYHSIPATHRTLAVYKSALSTFIRSNLFGLAEQGHAEALDRLENGHEVSTWLCRIAIENDMWDLASRVKQQLDAKHNGQASEWIDRIFWSRIADTPDLLSRAISLSKHYRMLNQAHTITAESQNFSVSLFKEAIIQQFTVHHNESASRLSRAERTFNDGRIRYLVGRIQLSERGAEDFYRQVLGALVRPDSRIHYPDAHGIVSYIYRLYRALPHLREPAKLFSELMRRTVELADTTRSALERTTSITPSMLEEDWIAHSGKLSLSMYNWLLRHYAKSGQIHLVRYYLGRLCEQYPSYADQKGVLWTLVYAHARRGEVQPAKSAFDEMQSLANAAGEELDVRVWNVLIHAHSRADDLEGALKVLTTLTASGRKPDVYTIHPVLELYAARGDVDGVQTLIDQFGQLSEASSTTELYGSLMTAHINANDVKSAHRVLETLIPKVQAQEVKGTLTVCFNILLTALALRREIDQTMNVYRWMKSEEVEYDSMTFAALMQSLAMHRQADAAWNLIKNVMPEMGLKPLAFHYAIVMTGFMRQHAYKTTLDVYRQMMNRGIRPTLSTNAIYVKAKALYELRQNPASTAKSDLYPVSLIVDELDDIFKDPAAGLASHEPQLYSPLENHSPQALLISQLIYAYGSAKFMGAVQELLDRYRAMENDEQETLESLPLQILSAVMPGFIFAKRWDEVERCWRLSQELADAKTKHTPVPRLAPKAEIDKAPEILKLSVAKTTSQAQAKAKAQMSKSNASSKDPPTRPSKSKPTSRPADPTKPVPALTHILSQPLRHQITSLALQRRFSEMISTVASTLSQGYTLDNSTWNIFIEHLLRHSPAPLALLAFRLVERYLIPSFPGWRAPREKINLSHRVQGLQHIKAAYLSPDVLMVRYRTMVKLGAALLELRRQETLGIGAKGKDGLEGLGKYVGTVRQIRQHAPKTMFWVQSLPTVEDRLQTTLLRRQSMV